MAKVPGGKGTSNGKILFRKQARVLANASQGGCVLFLLHIKRNTKGQKAIRHTKCLKWK
jgi:hypothetical protein